MILFYYNRYVMAGKSTTLPYLIDRWSQEIIEEFAEAFDKAKLTVKEGLDVMNSSRPLAAREKM